MSESLAVNIDSHVSLDFPLEESLHVLQYHMFASLHHGVGLCYTQVHTGCVDGTLALGAALVFAREFKVLLEEIY